jgi:hypothetical protein
MRLAFVLALALCAGLGACRSDKQVILEPGGPPPLPPASGTAVGYLIDAAGDLKLTDAQLTKLHQIDDSLAARNGQIDAQLRQIEKPAPGEELTPQQQKAGEQETRYNNAPGANTITNADAQKLHRIRDDNDRAALKEALALLDETQVERAKRILSDRGVAVPGEKVREETSSSEDGTPLPGLEQ